MTTTKYRCPRCGRVFDDPYAADTHTHDSTVPAEPVREIDARERQTRATTLDDWGASAFRSADEYQEEEHDE